MDQNYELSEVLEVASEAGHILLENGAEISRVEDIMSRIANCYGVDSGNFFVLSNGIFTTGNTGKVPKAGGQASTYANVEFIPIHGVQLSKVKAIIGNAQAVRRIRAEQGSFSGFLWNYTGGKTIVYNGHAKGDIPAGNGLSARIARDLRRRGMKYLGPASMYLYLQT